MNQLHPVVYLFNLAFAHPFWAAVVLYWLYSAAVDSLPDPNGSKGYQFLYAFLHKIAGNLSVAFSSKIPGVVPNSVNSGPSSPAQK